MNNLKKRQLYLLLGLKIKFFRSSKKLSQTDLASKLKLSRTSIVNIEQGKQHPPLHLLFQIAECLSIDIHNLIPTMEALSAVTEQESADKSIAGDLESFLGRQEDKYKETLEGFFNTVKSNEKK